MSDRLKWLTTGFLGLLVIATTYLLMHNHKTAKPVRLENPDAYITDLYTIQLNEEGNIHYELKSPKVVNYQLDNASIFTTPLMIVHNENKADGPPWYITALNGKTIDGFQKIILWDQVHIYQLPGPNSHNASLTTSELTFYPYTSKAQTDKPVTITQPTSIVNAIGLNANFKTGEIKLLSKARGSYHAGQ